MIAARWRNFRCISSSIQYIPWRGCRWQGTTATTSPAISPALLERARALTAEHVQLSKSLNDEYDSQLAKKIGSLSAVATAFNAWESTKNSLPELQQLITDPSTDSELRALATEELQATTEKVSRVSHELQTSLVPEHPFAELPCLVEIRPGTGGQEAALFAGDLLRMYQGFCKRKRLSANILKLDSAASVGVEDQIQEAILEVDSPGSYDILRCEAGVHRVQRVPATETKGRTHTSAVQVVVLPNFPAQGEEALGENSFDDPSSDYHIDPKELKTETMRSRGAGGQHVNTTDSRVRLTHIPTNTVVAIQESRSQTKNRQKALQLLRARLAQSRREAREEERAQLRVSLVGLSRTDRGDKIRTYNWSQQRVTDHRSGITLHHLDDMLEGGESLDHVITSVRDWLKMKDIEVLIADEEVAKSKT